MTSAQITDALAAAGVTASALALWWGSPHPALNYFSPRSALDLFTGVAEIEAHVLDVARADARALQRVAAEPRRRTSAAAHPGHMGGGSRCGSTV